MAAPRESSHELENLAGLLHDFGADGWTADRVGEAFAEIAARSLRLESFYETDAAFVTELTAGPKATLPLSDMMEVIGRSVHQYLFSGILRTAGEYRQADDPGGGFVSFGGPKGQTAHPLFRGSPAQGISGALHAAYARLVDAREDAWSSEVVKRDAARAEAEEAAILFYKDFSGVHPFYDANGRAGRYVVSVYLLLHGLHVRWADVDAVDHKLMKKINECLKRRDHADPALIATYEARLVRFWRPFVDAIPDAFPLLE